jgi:hypothetical protein
MPDYTSSDASYRARSMVARVIFPIITALLKNHRSPLFGIAYT